MSKVPNILAAAALAAATFSAYSANDAYKTARDQANATYKADRKACKDTSGEARQDCLRIATEKRRAEMAEAKKLKTHGALLNGDASQTKQSYSQLPASGAGSSSQRTAGNQPGESMGNAPISAPGSTSTK